jgi:hypothetical protein
LFIIYVLNQYSNYLKNDKIEDLMKIKDKLFDDFNDYGIIPIDFLNKLKKICLKKVTKSTS